MSIDKIRNIGLDKLVTQVYDFDSLTTDELLCKFAQKINIIIEHFKYLDDRCYNSDKAIELKLQYLLNEGLEEQVGKRLIELIDNGTLGNLINQTLLKDISDKVDSFKDEINKINYVNPSYLGVASHSYYTEDIETHLNKYKEIGCQFELVSFISVSENTSKELTASCVEKTKQWLNRAKELGVTCSLLKIHLVLNDDDGASKGNISVKSGEETEYFNNYKNELIKYLDICTEYGIKNFVFANENKNVFNIANYPYYSIVINSLKSLYPNIKFSYSMSGEESRLYLIDKLNTTNVLSLCDFISFNIYPSMSNYDYPNENETNTARQKICYGSGYDIRISNAITKYNKNIFITEVGCMGRRNSLMTPIDQDYENRPPKDSIIPGIYINNVIDIFAKRDAVEGLFIWSAREPFAIFNTSGESVLKDYCEEVFGNESK
jgi:hypothetical protein